MENSFTKDVWELLKKNSDPGLYVVAMLMFSLSKDLRVTTVDLLKGGLGTCLTRLDVITSVILAGYFILMFLLLIYMEVTSNAHRWELAEKFNDCLNIFYNPALMWMQLLTVVYLTTAKVTILGSLSPWLVWGLAISACIQGLLAILTFVSKLD